MYSGKTNEGKGGPRRTGFGGIALFGFRTTLPPRGGSFRHKNDHCAKGAKLVLIFPERLHHQGTLSTELISYLLYASNMWRLKVETPVMI
jgi:hypothetical protein